MQIDNSGGASPFFLIGDHAGVAIPEELADLGLPAAELGRHIALDIGIRQLGRAMAARMDAIFVHQHYSRLVIDCNRDPARWDAMPEVSDHTIIPGNQRLPPKVRADRIAAIHTPYHTAIAGLIEARKAAGRETIMVALHSFTPAMGDRPRPWQVGVLHHLGDTRYAHALLAALRAEDGLTVGDNEPYRMDQIDYSIPRHAYPDRLGYAEIEVRQDLLADDAGVAEWCARLTSALERARAALAR